MAVSISVWEPVISEGMMIPFHANDLHSLSHVGLFDTKHFPSWREASEGVKASTCTEPATAINVGATTSQPVRPEFSRRIEDTKRIYQSSEPATMQQQYLLSNG